MKMAPPHVHRPQCAIGARYTGLASTSRRSRSALTGRRWDDFTSLHVHTPHRGIAIGMRFCHSEGEPETAVVAIALIFAGDQCGRAGEAVDFYAHSIPGVTVGKIEPKADPRDPSVGDLCRAEFSIGGTPFIAFDGAGSHNFTFIPPISIWSCRALVDASFRGRPQRKEPAVGRPSLYPEDF